MFGEVVRQVKETADPETSGLERYVAGEHMTTDELQIRTWGTIGDGYLGPAFHRRFHNGQVLYGSRRTYLRKVALADFDGICANTTFVCETADKSVLLPELLPFIMQTDAFHAHSISQSKGSVNPYINWPDLAWFEFDLPSLREQREIATALAAADRVAKVTAGQVRAVSRARRTLFDHRIELLQGDTVLFRDIWSRPPESGCSAPSVDEDTGHFVLSLAALTLAGYRSGQTKPVKPSVKMISARLSKGDLLVSRSNTSEMVGFAARFPEDRSDVSFPDTMMRVSVDANRVLPEYVEALLMSRESRRHIRSVAAGKQAPA
jgi:type I restriction enzyme S subunit